MFAANLKNEREKRGWTQVQAAAHLHVKVPTLNAWENGYNQPNIQMLLHLITKYKITDTNKFLWGRTI